MSWSELIGLIGLIQPNLPRLSVVKFLSDFIVYHSYFILLLNFSSIYLDFTAMPA